MINLKELDLGKEKISKLIRKFAIPCVISMLVAALYNIVDQIYIGWSSAGTYGNAATNIVYPFTVLALAFALLIGDGASAQFSLSQGAKDKKKGNKSISNGLIMLIITSIIIVVVAFLFQDNILALFGADPKEELCYEYATSYFRIIAMGIPFYIIGQGLNSAIRSDGSPKYAMAATLSGAITNIILDPIFIFGFDMGVKGAAIATVIGQIVTFVLSIIYLTRSKQFKITKESVKLDRNIMKKILALGTASFITQVSIVIIISVANNLLAKYGYMTYASTGEVYGAVEPIAVVGICMKVFGIVVSAVIGVALGGQPIVGYNMGAGNTKRVKETCKTILTINVIIGIIAFLLFELCPNLIISIFGSNTSLEYQEFAKYCLNIFLGGIVLTCVIKSTSIFLQSMGSSFKSTLLALSRDVIFFVPAIVIIATVSQNIVTMLWSAVIADVLAFILAMILLKLEFNKLSVQDEVIDDTKELPKLESKLDRHVVVSISREYGSGGRYVGELLAKNLGIKFYDKELINIVAKESGLSKKYIEQIDQNKSGAYGADDKLYNAEEQVILDLAKRESCVIVGRCSDYILKDNKDTIKVFLYSTDQNKVARAVKYYGLNKDNALKEINKINKDRAKHYKYYTNGEWGKASNYDIMINVDTLGVEETAKSLSDLILNKNTRK